MIDREKERIENIELSMFLYFRDTLSRSPERASELFDNFESTKFDYSKEFWQKIEMLKAAYLINNSNKDKEND